MLEDILCHETCDVDLRNRLNGDTPLHIAVRQRWEDSEGLRLFLGMWGRNPASRVQVDRKADVVVENLLEAGADTL